MDNGIFKPVSRQRCQRLKTPFISFLLKSLLFSTSLLCFPTLALSHSGTHDTPNSQRSNNAIESQTPKLEAALNKKQLSLGSPIFIRIFKAEAELEVWVQSSHDTFQRFKTYPICTFSGKLGPKEKTGDLQSPEGFYFVSPNRMNPWSRFHLSFNLGYPNAYDRAHQRTGSALMVHGNCVSIGCYAMTDDKIEEIYTLADAALSQGQHFFRVHVFPFRMTEKNMEKYKNHRWYSFWQNLKEGYQWFEDYKVPPNVTVSNKRYQFNHSNKPQPATSSIESTLTTSTPTPADGASLSDAAVERTQHTVRYDGQYLAIDYPNGDVPEDMGVCTDVVIRAYRTLGIDLQEKVHEDMQSHFHLYPTIWGLKKPDSNIDHRRVPNLQTFFERHGESLPLSENPKDYLPGDLVTWYLPGNLPHIGIVIDKKSEDGQRPLIVHNIGDGPQAEDILFSFKITGHYRYYP